VLQSLITSEWFIPWDELVVVQWGPGLILQLGTRPLGWQQALLTSQWHCIRL